MIDKSPFWRLFVMMEIMKSTIIYVSGAPGSGKTTLAKHISKQLNIPQISSDLIHGGIAFTHPDHDRGETIRDIFVPYMIDTAKLGISFVVDHVLQKGIAKETIIEKLREHANVIYIHTQASDPITRYKYNIEMNESMDVKKRRNYLLARADHHANNLDNTMYKIELEVPTLEVNTDNNYTPSLEEIVAYIQSNKSD
jgi:adenylate kinase family enzyme